MSIEKLEVFASQADKNTDGITLKYGFPSAEKPARQWFNWLFYTQTSKINEVADLANSNFTRVKDIDLKYEQLKRDTTKQLQDTASSLKDVRDYADQLMQTAVGGKLAYKTYAEMIADKSNIAAKSSIDILADTDDKNGTYLYDGANFVKSKYDLEKLIRAKVQNTFDTYTQMVTSDLSNGAYALVADDADDKNGIYVKVGDSWVKAKYDPIAYTKGRFATEVEPFIRATKYKKNLLVMIDENGLPYVRFDEKGGAFLKGESESIQDSLHNINLKTDRINIIPVPSDVYRVSDLDGTPLLRFDKKGDAYFHGVEDSLREIADKAQKGSTYTPPYVAPYSKTARHFNDVVPFTEPFSRLMLSTKFRHDRVARVPSCLAPLDYNIGNTWVNQVKVTVQNPEDRVPTAGFDPSYREDIGLVHPFVIEYDQKESGYKYWMAITPYTDGDDRLENPFIYGTNDPELHNWELIPDFPAPFERKPTQDEIDSMGATRGHRSDPFITYDPINGDLVLAWRTTMYLSGGEMKNYLNACIFDGVSWSEQFTLFGADNNEQYLLSPAIIYNPDEKLFYMYYAYKGVGVMYRTTKDLRSATWSEPTKCGITGGLDEKWAWHLEVKFFGKQIVMLLHVDDQQSAGTSQDAYYMGVSSDFKNFAMSDTSIISNDVAQVYKASFLPVFTGDNEAKLKIIYTTDSSTEKPWFLLHVSETNTVNIGV